MGGPAHNFQIYVQMFLAKRPTGRSFLPLSLFLAFPRAGKISIVKFRGIEKCFRGFLAPREHAKTRGGEASADDVDDVSSTERDPLSFPDK